MMKRLYVKPQTDEVQYIPLAILADSKPKDPDTKWGTNKGDDNSETEYLDNNEPDPSGGPGAHAFNLWE